MKEKNLKDKNAQKVLNQQNPLKIKKEYNIPIYFDDQTNLKNEMINQDAVKKNVDEILNEKENPRILEKK